MKLNVLSRMLIVSLSVLFILGGCAGKQEVAETDVKNTTPTKDIQKPSPTMAIQNPSLKYLGRSSVKIKTAQGTVIYIDPFAGSDYDEPADIVLITHEHEDHNLLRMIKDTSKAKVIRSADSIANGTYKNFQVKDIKIEAVAAYNENHMKEECVGYILEFDGLKLYHAGDTSKIKEMDSFASKNLDYALLPIDGVYNMDPIEAMECAKIINAKHNIPIHSSGSSTYNQENVDNFKPQNVLPIKVDDVIPLKAME